MSEVRQYQCDICDDLIPKSVHPENHGIKRMLKGDKIVVVPNTSADTHFCETCLRILGLLTPDPVQ